ncbi:MAG: InlB B-repeat-containing protein, partial [Oscillospiraceae bacterium]|nr:InlB B-repeat-containing protein [Oscillospiraceae bacterium]
MSGGVVKAKGSYIHAAGIGGGHASVGGTVLISGGTITAEGAGGSGSSSGGAGIGGSDTIVSIIGGTVTATGCFGGAGIGGSGGRVGGTISIVGGTVHATGSNYTSNSAAGIGTGAHQAAGSTIEISGGTVTAIAGTIGNSSAVGRSTNGSMGTVSITGTYKFWLNTANTAPNEQTFVEGTFDDDNLFPSTAGYKYMKLESQDTTPSSKTYDVIFFDWDGTMLDQQIVESGEAAVEPSAPVRSGYSFIGWDQEFDNVTSDLTVTALYEICIIDDPFTLSLGSNTRTSSSSATVDFTSSAEGKYYYKVIGSKEVAPSADEIKSDNDGNRMLQGKNTVNISDLPSADACKIYIVGENNEGLMSDVLVVDIGKYATDTGGLPLGPPDKPAPPTPTPTDLPDEPEDKEDKKIIPGTYSDWAREELSRALAMGLIPTSLLNANIDLRRPISRVEFAGVTVKAYENLANTTVLPNVYNPFTDTQDVDALKAFNAGIMIGISLTEFSPHTELNREQAATALTRVFKRSTISGWTFETDSNYPMNYTRPEPFDDDADISDWAKDSVYFMVANRIILGVGYNVFAPRAVTSV